MTESLEVILEDIWGALSRGVRSARHPFHTGVLATVGSSGPELRTVVLRNTDRTARAILCHSDARSAKLEQLRRNPSASWLFYDPKRKVQLRLRGSAQVHTGDALAQQRWGNTSAQSRRCYSVDPAPGTAIPEAGSGLSEALVECSPSQEESEPWVDRFAVIETRVRSVEWLLLRAKGHRRARFEWVDGSLDSTWLIP